MKALAALTPGNLRLRDLRALLNPQKAIQRILREAIRKTNADGGSFILLNPNTDMLDIEAAIGLSQKAATVKLRKGEGVTGWVATTGKPLRVGDVRLDPKYVAVNPKVLSEMAVPVSVRGYIVGVLNVDCHRVSAFTAKDEKRLISFADEAAEWLQTVWEIDQLRQKDRQLTTLIDMGQRIIAESKLELALRHVTRAANKLMNTKLCSLQMVSADGESLTLRASDGASEQYRNKPDVPINESLVGVVINRRKPLSVLNVQENESFRHIQVAREEGLRSLLAVPLIFGDKALGVLVVYTETIHRFSNDEIKLLTTLGDLSSVAIEKAGVWERTMSMEEDLRVGERLSALGVLAAEVAHEIRNPLTVMQMLFHALVEEAPLDEHGKRDAEIIADKMRQMNRILDQVLGFARSSEPTKESVDPGDLVEDIVLLVRHKLEQMNIRIRKRISPGLPPLRVDRAQIEQAILNIVLNATDAMDGGGLLTLEAKSAELDGHPVCQLSVRDSGHGMSKDQLESLFAPFLTDKPGGTGIGLAIVRKIIENHGGKVGVKSAPGRGTTFQLFLPADETASREHSNI